MTERRRKFAVLAVCLAALVLCTAAALLYQKRPSVPASPPPLTADVPVLVYHHVADEGYGDSVISPRRFEEHLNALAACGFTPVAVADMTAFVDTGKPLPPRPVLITFDDGYLSNYTAAYPLLLAHRFKAVFFAIGVSFGKDSYKDTGTAIIPHYGAKEAGIMRNSGLIEIGSHTYDMHQSESLESGRVRDSVLRFADEPIGDYLRTLKDDFDRFEALYADKIGGRVQALSYPHGLATDEAEREAGRHGVRATFTTLADGRNTLRKGDRTTLYRLYRITVMETMSASDVLSMILERYGK